MVDWTEKAIKAAWEAMLADPYVVQEAPMIIAGLDAAAATQGLDADLAVERERVTKLRAALVKARPLINGLLAPASLLATIDAVLKETEE